MSQCVSAERDIHAEKAGDTGRSAQFDLEALETFMVRVALNCA